MPPTALATLLNPLQRCNSDTDLEKIFRGTTAQVRFLHPASYGGRSKKDRSARFLLKLDLLAARIRGYEFFSNFHLTYDSERLNYLVILLSRTSCVCVSANILRNETMTGRKDRTQSRTLLTLERLEDRLAPGDLMSYLSLIAPPNLIVCIVVEIKPHLTRAIPMR